VVLHHSVLFGSADLLVDGQPVFHRAAVWRDGGFIHRFDIGGVNYAVRVEKVGTGQFLRTILKGPDVQKIENSNCLRAIAPADALLEITVLIILAILVLFAFSVIRNQFR
jgi:hypothetical protein